MAGEIEATERSPAKKREAVATLDSVIAMFEPDCRPDMIPSVRPYLLGESWTIPTWWRLLHNIE
jgi:hypothetical protein